jgi:hypothetical protein
MNGRPGRKPLPATQGKRASLGLKVTPKIKNQLDAAAKANGRTQSQEAEARLEHSFATERLMVDALVLVYGRQLAGLLLEAGDLVSEVGRSVAFSATHTLDGAENWLSHPLAYDQAIKALTAVLHAFRPTGEIVPLGRQRTDDNPDLQRVLDAHASDPGLGLAKGHVAFLTREIEIGGVAGEKVATKRELLGDLVERLRPPEEPRS